MLKLAPDAPTAGREAPPLHAAGQTTNASAC